MLIITFKIIISHRLNSLYCSRFETLSFVLASIDDHSISIIICHQFLNISLLTTSDFIIEHDKLSSYVVFHNDDTKSVLEESCNELSKLRTMIWLRIFSSILSSWERRSQSSKRTSKSNCSSKCSALTCWHQCAKWSCSFQQIACSSSEASIRLRRLESCKSQMWEWVAWRASRTSHMSKSSSSKASLSSRDREKLELRLKRSRTFRRDFISCLKRELERIYTRECRFLKYWWFDIEIENQRC